MAAGIYSATVTDATLCSIVYTDTIEDAAPISITTAATDNSCFGGSLGAIDITVTGGISPYTYLWSNASTTEDLTGLTIGTYSVTVTDANNCTATTSETITEPTQLTLTSSATALTCGNDPTGAVDLTISGGTAPYTQLWSNGATTEDITGLLAGVYSVTVTDDNGCTATTSRTVSSPMPITITSTSTDVTCN